MGVSFGSIHLPQGHYELSFPLMIKEGLICLQEDIIASLQMQSSNVVNVMYVFVIGNKQLLTWSRVLVVELSESVTGDEFANKT